MKGVIDFKYDFSSCINGNVCLRRFSEAIYIEVLDGVIRDGKAI